MHNQLYLPDMSISIHAPAKGATTEHAAAVAKEYDFNPRSREGSDAKRAFREKIFYDFNPRSREGSDRFPSYPLIHRNYFNPRSREGSDRRQHRATCCGWKFQSTLPRRERPFDTGIRLKDLLISIHAPAKGATTCSGTNVVVNNDFNPRSREGSDERSYIKMARQQISIHAPAKGATVYCPCCGQETEPNFNPRSREGSDGNRTMKVR